MSFRPDIRSINDSTELRRCYWRKAKLVDRARKLNLKTTASKFELLDCIAHFLDTGTAIEQPQKRKNIKSKFNWHIDVLTPETIISDSYKNTQNVRLFSNRKLALDLIQHPVYGMDAREHWGNTERCMHRLPRNCEQDENARISDIH